MKEKGLRIRKTKEAWRADYKTTTTIQAMSDSEAFSLFFFESPTTSYLIADKASLLNYSHVSACSLKSK